MNLSTSGLLLLLVGFLLLAGFLTGNLDRWTAYLFDPARPKAAATGSSAGTTTAPLVGSLGGGVGRSLGAMTQAKP